MSSAKGARAESSDWLLRELARISPAAGTRALALTDELHAELQIDSLDFIQLLIAFEETFGVRLDETKLLISNYTTVGDLVEIIDATLESPARDLDQG